MNDFLERFKVHKLVLPASWGWRKPRGDGHPETETRDGHPNLGLADPRLGIAVHTWGWVVRVSPLMLPSTLVHWLSTKALFLTRTLLARDSHLVEHLVGHLVEHVVLEQSGRHPPSVQGRRPALMHPFRKMPQRATGTSLIASRGALKMEAASVRPLLLASRLLNCAYPADPTERNLLS